MRQSGGGNSAAVGGKKTNTIAAIAALKKMSPEEKLQKQKALFAPRPAAGAGARSGGAPAGGAAPPADDGLRPSEKLAAGRIKMEFEATSEHGGIRVVENGGWDDVCKHNPAWVMRPRQLKGEEGDAHQARFAPEWLKTFRGGAVAAAVNKDVVTIVFKLVLKRDLVIPAWECWDYDAPVSAKKIFSCADTNALEKAWLTQNGGKLGGGQARGAKCDAEDEQAREWRQAVDKADEESS
ncbi:hypothetical protein T484DRAFT_1842662 [Baffinella frigidus]|nr:hypothetical protein T484DRAFT_1842662 [Cryptophyta sp. CCMP2293]